MFCRYLRLLPLLLLTLSSLEAYAQGAVPSSWNYADRTGQNATIILPMSATSVIRGRDFQAGDAIGVFFLRDNALTCGGYAVWTGSNVAIAAWGDNPQTAVKDGFASNEQIRIRLWDAQNGVEVPASVSYVMGGGTYQTDGIFSFDSVVSYESPTVTLTEPVGGTSVEAGVTLTVSASAGDPDGDIQQVSFYEGGTKIGEDTSAPYSVAWTPTSSGSATLTATAEDAGGRTGSSAPVVVEVAASMKSIPSDWEKPDKRVPWGTVEVPSTLESSIDGRSLATGDAVGAFFTRNDSLISGGHSIWEEDSALEITIVGDDPRTSIKDGFYHGEEIRYRIWDSVGGRELDVDAVYASGRSTFAAGGSHRLYALYRDEAPQTNQNVKLRAGWNIASGFVAPMHPNIEDVFDDLASLVVVYDREGRSYRPGRPQNDLGTWEAVSARRIYVSSRDSLNLRGVQVRPERTPVEIEPGWNLIPYLRTSGMAVDSALASISHDLLMVKSNDGRVYWPNQDIRQLDRLVPGEGYAVYARGATELTYPANVTSSPVEETNDSYAALPEGLQPTGTSAVLVVESDDFAGAEEVEVYTAGGTLAGHGAIDGDRAVVTLWGDDPVTTSTQEAAREGEELSLYATTSTGRQPLTLQLITDGMSGHVVAMPLRYNTDGAWVVMAQVTTGVAAEDEGLPADFTLMQNYPNPFNPVTTIEYSLPAQEHVLLEVVNVLGRRVAVLVDGNQHSGDYKVTFDAGGLASGVYIYRLRAGGREQMRRMVLLE